MLLASPLEPSAASTLAQLRGGRVYGGRNATIEEFPYQVSLEYFMGFRCGGSIITHYHVITGAHCIPESEKLHKYLRVRAGATFIGQKGSLHNVAKAYTHEKHYSDEFDNPKYDVALLKVKEKIVFGKTRQPIPLFGRKEEFEVGSLATVTGWGKTETGYPKQLQTVEVPLINTKVCDYLFSREFNGLKEGEICAGYVGIGKKDACNGDSGGPLVLKGRLIGIVSYGNGCALPDYPGVYTEIAYYRDWIDQRLKM